MSSQKLKQEYQKVSLKPSYLKLEIPKKWKNSRCDDLVDLKSGFAFKSSDFSKTEGIKVVKIEQIELDGRVNIKNCECVNVELTDRLKNFLIKKNDILISLTGELIKIGKVSEDDILLLNQRVGNCKIKDESKLISDYLFHILYSQIIKKPILVLRSEHAQPNLGKNEFDEMVIVYPDSVQEQEKISSILTRVNNLIGLYNKILEKTIKLKHGLMQQLLTKGIDHKKFKKEKFCFNFLTDMFPDDWDNVKIKDISNVVRGGSPRPAGDPKYFGGPINWITVGELTKDDFMLLNSTKSGLTNLGMKQSRFLEQDTVVISNSGYTLGHPKILNISGCINDGIAAFLDLDETINPKFLYYSLKLWTKHLRNVNQGVFQVNLNTGILGNLYLPLPKIKEQDEIVKILLDYDNYIEKLELKFRNIIILKENLMMKLLTGQIRVKV